MSWIGPLVCPVLVGRDDLLELADRRISEVAAGRGHVIFMAGDPGIGKSRLLAAVERRATSAGFRSATGAVAPQDRDVAGAAIRDLALSLGRSPESRDAARAITSRLDEAFAEPEPSGGRGRRLLVLDLVDALAGVLDRPTLLAFEDVHWADDLSLDVLGALARRQAELPVFIVATVRSEEIGRNTSLAELRALLITQRLAEEIRLARLSRAETAVMVNVLRGSEPLRPDVIEAIHARTDGIPLHVEELVGALAERGRWTAQAVTLARVPDTIEATILERLRHRSDDARHVASIGAVIGRRFGPTLVAGASGWPEDRLSGALEELVEHAFLDADPLTGELDFRNQLVRDAIYGALPGATRRRLHGTVADLTNSVGGSGEAARSLHLELAGRTDEAHQAARQAARAAAAISAHREALELYRRAARTIPRDADPAARGYLLRELAAEEVARDDPDAASASLDLARAAFLEAGDPVAAADVVAQRVGARHLLGDGLGVVRPLLQEALASIADREGPRPDTVRGRLEAALANAHGLALELPATETHAARAFDLAAATGDELTELTVSVTHANALMFLGRADEAIGIMRDTVERARRNGLDDVAGRAYRLAGSSLSEVNAYEAAEAWFRDGIAFAERSELWNHRCYMTAHLGLILWATGRWDEADASAAAALQEGRGGLTTQVTGRYVRGYVALGRGRADEADALLGEALALGERFGDILRISLPLWGLAENALLSGRVDAAVELSERGRAISEAVADLALLMPFLVTGTRARLQGSGGIEEARRWVQAVGEPIRDGPIAAHGPAVDHARGLVALASGDLDAGRTALGDAVRGWDRVRRVWEATWARQDLAGCLLRMRRRAEATDLVLDARAIAESLGSRPLTERAIELLADARGHARPEEPWAPLTHREYEVARLVVTGSTNAEIGAELSITTKTVASHIEHILNKLGVSRRAEIAAWTARIADAETTHASR